MSLFGVTPAGLPVEMHVLRNSGGTEARVLTYGGIIQTLLVRDRSGVLTDVTPGYDDLDGYLRDGAYFGALVGRYANRIAHARFSLDDRVYTLPCNEGRHHLHGGRGFNTVVWAAEPFVSEGAAGVVLRYTSPDGEDGYPGTLDTRVTYTLTASDELVFDFHASTDRATPVALTQHSYLNLAGHDAGEIVDHELTIFASRFTPVDAGLIPTGELRLVRGTPFDFTYPHRIGDAIDAADDQIRTGHGYDHNFVLDRTEPGGLTLAARLREPRSGRVVEILTTEPGIQFYSGNALGGGAPAKDGAVYVPRGALALETQHFPDSPNQPDFPSTILRPGERYASRTIYRFLTSGRGM